MATIREIDVERDAADIVELLREEYLKELS